MALIKQYARIVAVPKPAPATASAPAPASAPASDPVPATASVPVADPAPATGDGDGATLDDENEDDGDDADTNEDVDGSGGQDEDDSKPLDDVPALENKEKIMGDVPAGLARASVIVLDPPTLSNTKLPSEAGPLGDNEPIADAAVVDNEGKPLALVSASTINGKDDTISFDKEEDDVAVTINNNNTSNDEEDEDPNLLDDVAVFHNEGEANETSNNIDSSTGVIDLTCVDDDAIDDTQVVTFRATRSMTKAMNKAIKKRRFDRIPLSKVGNPYSRDFWKL